MVCWMLYLSSACQPELAAKVSLNDLHDLEDGRKDVEHKSRQTRSWIERSWVNLDF